MLGAVRSKTESMSDAGTRNRESTPKIDLNLYLAEHPAATFPRATGAQLLAVQRLSSTDYTDSE